MTTEIITQAPASLKERSLAERIRRHYEKFAPDYDERVSKMERRFFKDGRAWVASRAVGDVLEPAIGTGRNLPFYPEGVRVHGTDFSPAMLSIARERAGDLGMAVELSEGDAQSLPFEDESFDTVVITLALCTIPDVAAALREAHRVLRPGGRLLLLEHVKSTLLIPYALQRILEPITMLTQGDHMTRDPLPVVKAQGFRIDEYERYKWGIVERLSATKV